MQQTINNRYVLQRSLGSGGMGIVHLAYDRLTQQTVALKQVEIAPTQLAFTTRATDATEQTLRLSLAQEFQTLASLRHPHIISVLDYGFDTKRQPFYTMTYLPEAQTIRDAAEGVTLQKKIGLIQQLLQALAYLHRRGVLHRDLKPENVLVVHGQVRVLDFGLAVKRDESPTGSSGGSAAYMAPELWLGEPPQEATDLFAVGIILYELLAGKHPFAPVDASLIYRVLQDEPNLDLPGVDEALTQVIGRLLIKKPEERFNRVSNVLKALSGAIGEQLPVETRAIRESYLQAAEFVGRDAEMAQLTQALEQAAEGQGSIWLVGGESGVGKSRLLEELRTHALVAGWQVLTGQAVSDGGVPYQVWHNIVPQLVLSTELSELEAGVLKTFVPRLSTLLGYTVEDPLEIEGTAAYNRLMLTLTNILERQNQPTFLLLEDLQWSAESLEPLTYIQRIINRTPLLIVGSYRNDEKPHLPESLPQAKVIALERFNQDAIHELSRSMLGDRQASQEEIVTLLERETEGNVFFLIEVVRALAEEAGQLAFIGQMELPQAVFTGGMQEIVQRRLSQVPAVYQSLLQQAAVAGRELDLTVLAALDEKQDLSAWLGVCQEAAVLSIQANQWRFAHDKLREGLLSQLTAETRPRLHRQIAQAIEQVYPQETTQFEALAQHWHMAGNEQKERHYAAAAGRYAAGQFANEKAISFFNQALALTAAGNLSEQYDILLDREAALARIGNQEAQSQDLKRLEQIVTSLNEPDKQAEVALRQAKFAHVTGDYSAAIAASERAAQLAQTADSPQTEINSYRQWTQVLQRLGQLEEAQTILEKSLSISKKIHDRRQEGLTLSELGAVAKEMGNYEQAIAHYENALEILRDIGAKRGEGEVLYRMGIAARVQGKSSQAQNYFLQSLAILRQIGDWQVEWQVLRILGTIAMHKGAYEEALSNYQAGLEISRQINHRPGEAIILNSMAQMALELGFIQEALEYFSSSNMIYRSLNDLQGQSMTSNNLGEVFMRLGRYDEAQTHLGESNALTHRMGDRLGQGITSNNLGLVSLYQGNFSEARARLSESLSINKQVGNILMSGYLLSQTGLALLELNQDNITEAMNYVSDILEYIQSNETLTGCDTPFFILLTCYRVLNAGHDSRAPKLLTNTYHMLMERASRIHDETTRHKFLENRAEYREIIRLYQSFGQG
ncbi:MAG: tetratricopeptide repeat protein [Candidatus Promineifilaceae bacterium]